MYNIPARFRERLAEIFPHSVILGWAAEHFECHSRNLADMFLHNYVVLRMFQVKVHRWNRGVSEGKFLAFCARSTHFSPPLRPPLSRHPRFKARQYDYGTLQQPALGEK